MDQLQSTDKKINQICYFFDTVFWPQCGWGIEVLNKPIFGLFQMRNTISRGHPDIPGYYSIVGEDLYYYELAKHVWEVTSFWP